jgi:hypothetical protein
MGVRNVESKISQGKRNGISFRISCGEAYYRSSHGGGWRLALHLPLSPMNRADGKLQRRTTKQFMNIRAFLY